MTENDAIVLVLVMSTLGFVATVLILTYYARRRLRSQEIVKAIEHGQSMPMEPRRRRRLWIDDLRTGVLLVSFSVGFFLLIWILDGAEAVAIALIPLFIGFGYLINFYLSKRYGLNGDAAAEADTGSPIVSEPDADAPAGPPTP